MPDRTPTVVAPPSNPARRWSIAVAAGFAGGISLGAWSAAVSSSGTGGWAFWVENVAGPWMTVAFLVGALGRRRLPGAVAGAVAMVTAVAVYDLGRDLAFVRPLWLVAGVTAGLLFGLLGGWWAERSLHAWFPAGLAGGAIAGEALALSVDGLPHPLFSSRLAAIQVIAGLAGAALLGWRRGWWRAFLLASVIATTTVLLEMASGFPSRLVW